MRRDKGTGRAKVVSFSGRGIGISDLYALADIFSGWQPDLVVIELNLARFTPQVRDAWSRSDLGGWVEPARLPRALTLPLYDRRLTADALLFRVAMVQTGADALWERLALDQARAHRAVRLAATWLDEQIMDPAAAENMRLSRYESFTIRHTASDGERLTALGVKRLLGPVIEGVDRDHPVLEVLGALLRFYRERGIEVIVFASPLNLEHFESLGIMEHSRLPESLVAIREEVETSGAHFLDFHDRLPDAAFRDHLGHLTTEGSVNGTSMLAQMLTDELRAAFEDLNAR